MAVLGSYKRIYKQDFSKPNQDDFGTLSINVNDSFTNVYEALTNQITFADNINCTITTFTTSVNSTFNPITPLLIKLNNYQKTISGIWVINATAVKGNTLPTGGMFLNYSINNTTGASSNTTNSGNNSANPLTITINSIFGIPKDTQFSITAIII